MTDITRNGLFNQKRKPDMAVFNPTEAQILAVAGVANLPPRSIVLAVYANVLTASTTVGANVSLRVGATAIATNMDVATTGVKKEAVVGPQYFATGGLIEVIGGAVPPAAGDLVSEYIVEYIELDKVTGEYTA